MASTIKLKNGTGVPTAGALVQGEPAFDLTNKRLYTENAGGTVIEIGTNPSTIDINAGTIDGTIIGATTPASVAATTGSFSDGLVLTGSVPNIQGGSTTGGVSVSNSDISSYVLVYGSTNITYPNQVQITTGAASHRFSASGVSVAGTLSTTGAATFASSATIKGGNELRVNRADNATYNEIKYVTSGDTFYFNQANGGAYSFNISGTPWLSVANTGAATFSGNVNLRGGTTSAMSHWSSGNTLVTNVGSSGWNWDSYNGGATLFSITNAGAATFSGNVGIGTSSLTGGNTILNLSRTGSGVGCNIQFANSHNGAFYVGLAGNTSGDAILHSADGTAGMAFGTGNTERMRIDSAGNLTLKNSNNIANMTTAAITLTGAGAGGTGGQTINIASTSYVGVLAIATTQNVSALYYINGSSATQVVVQNAVDARFSNTSGSANVVNIYVSGSDIVLENNIQATRSFYITFMGKF